MVFVDVGVLQQADENRQMETRSSGRDSRPIHPVMHLAFAVHPDLN